MMMKFLTCSIFMFSFLALPAQARPVSYPGGWTMMLMNDAHGNSAHVHYSPSAKMSVGVRSEYRREGEYLMNSVQMNNLLKRWNEKDSQANLYLKSGIGVAYSDTGDFDGETDAAGFTGIAADWEDRRYFVSYENRYIEAGDIDDGFMQSARVGITPYIGDYGDLHTWLMLQVDHVPESDEPITVTPLVRFFKGVHLMEAGISNQGDTLFNYVLRF